jgi:hypothetical protein
MGVGKPCKASLLNLWAIGLLLSTWPGNAAQGAAAADGAQLRGTVQDVSGRPVAGAQVTARSLSLGSAGASGAGLTHSARSSSDGRFEIAPLPPGSYQVEIAADGAGVAAPQQVELTSGETSTLTFVLTPGLDPLDTAPPEEEVRERIEEEEETSPAGGNLIRESQLVGLPLNGRSYSQLATLQSDVNDTSTGSASRGTGGGSLTMAGGRSLANHFLLDGTTIMNAENEVPRSAAGVQLGSDAVFQVQVFSNYYSAEYGRSSGGVLNSITRSGTPQFHGTFFEYFRNSKLDARNFFDKEAEPPPFKRNQFGFTLTGPVVKDTTFFMASFEAMRDRLNQTAVNYFPDEGARVGDLGDGRLIPVDPRVKPYLDLYPIPNDIRLGRGIGRNLAPQFQPTNENFLTVRVDHRLTERDSFFARYTFDDASSRSAEETYLFQTQNLSRQQYLTLVGIHTFSPRTLNSVRLGYTRPSDTEDDVSSAAIPRELFFTPTATRFGQIRVPGLSNFGPNWGPPAANILNSFQFADDVILQRGAHGIRLGFEVQRFRSDVFNSGGQTGEWFFNSLEGFLQAGPVGTSLWVTLPGSDNHHGFRQTLAGFYLQDEYRMRPNFQVTLGLRYEFVTQIRDTQNRIAVLKDPVRDTVADLGVGRFSENNPSLRNLAPRVSISWSPGAGGSTNVSAGFGIYYDQVLNYTAVHRKNSAPYYHLVNNPNVDASTFFPNILAGAAGFYGQVQATDYSNLRTPMVLRYNFSLRQQLPGNWQVQAAYGGARGNRLFRRYEINQFPVPIVEPDGSLFFPPDRGAVNPSFGSINFLSTDAQSFYNSVQLTAGRNVGRGISVQAGYTYSKSVDDSSSGLQWGSIQYGLDRTLERALSDFDVRHRLAFNYFYTLPFGGAARSGVTGFLAKALGGWRVGGIASIRSGTPFSPEVSIRYPGYLLASRRPDLVPGRSNNPVEGVTDGCGSVRGGRKLGGPELYFDPCSFAPPAPGRLGTAGRNTIIASRVFNMDFSLQREFFLDATKRLQFRAELFNLPNHTNFAAVANSGLTVFSGESGGRTSTAGRISRTATTSRQIQFALRFSF